MKDELGGADVMVPSATFSYSWSSSIMYVEGSSSWRSHMWLEDSNSISKIPAIVATWTSAGEIGITKQRSSESGNNNGNKTCSDSKSDHFKTRTPQRSEQLGKFRGRAKRRKLPNTHDLNVKNYTKM